MSIWAVSGAAGCGKTYRLMERLTEVVKAKPLLAGEAVLALTYMHGSRLRLDRRLQLLPEVKAQFTCTTIDSFARRLRERWLSLGKSFGLPPPNDVGFDDQCAMAGILLDQPEVRKWIASSYPVLIIDEAQDLDENRLRIVTALRNDIQVLIAFDDFQCLREELRPNPVSVWLPSTVEVEVLEKPWRTDVSDLLNAALALRSACPPIAKGKFKIVACPGVAQASAYLASAIHWSPKGAGIAVITPSKKGGFVEGIVARVSTTPCGIKKIGPYPVRWELNNAADQALLDALDLDSVSNLGDLAKKIRELPPNNFTRQLASWTKKQRYALGKTEVSKQEVADYLKRQVALRRTRAKPLDYGIPTMTVHQAKNREFDGVVVIWPFTVAGDDESKRRLLYNAVTRARKWCTVIVQNESLLSKAPFI